MSVELRQLKDAVTGQPFVPITHWDAISNKPNIDGSLNSINASLNVLDASVKTLDASVNALDASIKNINIPIKSITGETGLEEYANSEFVAVSVSEPDENGNVNIDASVKVVTLADASNGYNGLASSLDIYNNLSNAEEVIASVISKLNYTIGLDVSANLVWSEESGLTEDTIKEAIEYVSMNAGVKINDSSVNVSETWSSSKINSEIEANAYILPTASANELGGVKVGEGLIIDTNGVLSAEGKSYTAGSGISISANDEISVDTSSIQEKLTAGSNITIDSNTISATDTTYNEASQTISGLMSAADKTKLDGLSNYILPTASANALGGIKVGENLSIDANGVLSASAPGATYTASSPLAIDNNNNITIDLSAYITKATADTLYNPKNTTTDNATQSASTIKLPTWNANGQIIGSKQVYEQQLNINNTGVHSVNDTSTSAVSLYAPTTGGTAGQILISNGNTAAPSWQYLNVDATVIISDEDASLGNYSADIAAFYQASIAQNKVQDVMIMIKEMHVDPSTAETTYSYAYYYPSAQRIYEGNVELWLLYTEDCITWTNIYYLINSTVTRTVTTGTFGVSNP